MRDHALANGVVAKIVVFSLEERQRIKIVDYEGLTHIDRSKIDDAFAEAGIQLRLDSFVDPGALRRASRTIRDLYAQAGYPFATVKPEIAAIAGGPRVVHVTFHVASGPRVKIRDVRFIGNAAVSDRALRGALEVNRPEGLPVLTKGGVYKEDRFAEDAEALTAYYRDRGYIDVRIGEPDVRPLDDSPDGGTRWVQLRIPVSEGRQYIVGNFTFDGNKVVKSEALQHLFKVKAGQVYDEAAITKGLDSAREIYGSGGYFEFTAYPDLHPRPEGEVPPGGPAAEGRSPAGLPVVDVTMRVTEGDQYFVHRIAFTGNTNTRDQVIRRELSLVEGGVFSTEALKTSIRRLNQLGYFKALDDSAVQVEKAADREHQVDVQLKLQEENRNQIMFGAGVSQYDGFFGSTSVHDRQPDGARRELHALAAEGLAGERLPGVLHRAVPVQPSHQWRRQPLLDQGGLPRERRHGRVQRGQGRGVGHGRPRAHAIHARDADLHVRGHQRQRPGRPAQHRDVHGLDRRSADLQRDPRRRAPHAEQPEPVADLQHG